MCDAMTGSCDKCDGCKYYCQPEVYCGPDCDHHVPVDCEESNSEIDRLNVQLAGCSVAALGYANGSNDTGKGEYGWSPSYQDVKDLRHRYDASQKLVRELNNRGCELADQVGGSSVTVHPVELAKAFIAFAKAANLLAEQLMVVE